METCFTSLFHLRYSNTRLKWLYVHKRSWHNLFDPVSQGGGAMSYTASGTKERGDKAEILILIYLRSVWERKRLFIFLLLKCHTSWSRCNTNIKITLLRNECLFYGFMGVWIVARDKQIAWTAKRFSGDLFVPRYDSYPMNPEKRHSFLIITMFPTRTLSKIRREKLLIQNATVTGT